MAQENTLPKEMKNAYDRWCEEAVLDPDLLPELKTMDEAKIRDAFWRALEFGTAGLRGVIGAGLNRMNVYTVAAASQGLADYVHSAVGQTEGGKEKIPSAVIGYDTRNKSRLFAETAAATLAANGVRVYIWPAPLPVPCVSFAVRYLLADTGVMVTASHNPSIYNGYKVYGPDGCQMTEEGSAAVSAAIDSHDIFDGVRRADFAACLAAGTVSYIPDGVLTAFIEAVKKCSVLGPGDRADRDVAIVYSPLNGTGLVPVTRILGESGYTNITVVEEQKNPDGNFPTCPYPNPEIREALALGLEYAERLGADLMLATDPDCDRVGIAVRKPDGQYTLLTGNQTGMLLLDYLCSRRKANGTLPADAMFVKTIVTSDICERIGAHYGVRCADVLTGFKYIGEQVTGLQRNGREEAFVLGFEESYGYLSGDHVREKDGVNAAFLICEMFSFYKAQGTGLYEKLRSLYAQFGYTLNVTDSFAFAGEAGFGTMKQIMADLRRGIREIGGTAVEKTQDYLEGINGLPKADVLKYYLADGSRVTVRPSGTEPKLKAYVEVSAETEAAARGKLEGLRKAMAGMMKG